MVRQAATTTTASATTTAAGTTTPTIPIYPPTLHSALTATAAAITTLWETQANYCTHLFSLSANTSLTASELRDFLGYNLGVKVELVACAMLIAFCNGQNKIHETQSDQSIPLSFLLKCLKLTALGRKNWLSPPSTADFLPWSVFVLQNNTNLMTSKDSGTITTAIENTNVSRYDMKKLKMLQPVTATTTTKKKHVLFESSSLDSIPATSEPSYSSNRSHSSNMGNNRSSSSNRYSKQPTLLPTIIGSHKQYSMKGKRLLYLPLLLLLLLLPLLLLLLLVIFILQ